MTRPRTRWSIKLSVERENTGQYFASWPATRIGSQTMPAAVGRYADTTEGAVCNGLRLIAAVVDEMSSPAQATTQEAHHE